MLRLHLHASAQHNLSVTQQSPQLACLVPLLRRHHQSRPTLPAAATIRRSSSSSKYLCAAPSAAPSLALNRECPESGSIPAAHNACLPLSQQRWQCSLCMPGLNRLSRAALPCTAGSGRHLSVCLDRHPSLPALEWHLDCSPRQPRAPEYDLDGGDEGPGRSRRVGTICVSEVWICVGLH